jgi:hypothetical protein
LKGTDSVVRLLSDLSGDYSSENIHPPPRGGVKRERRTVENVKNIKERNMKVNRS